MNPLDTLRKLEAETAQRLYKGLDSQTAADMVLVQVLMVLLLVVICYTAWHVFG